MLEQNVGANHLPSFTEGGVVLLLNLRKDTRIISSIGLVHSLLGINKFYFSNKWARFLSYPLFAFVFGKCIKLRLAKAINKSKGYSS